MSHRYLLEALGRTLRGITGTPLPFGNKVIVFIGEFCQTLPVVQRGGRAQIINASPKTSPLWTHFVIHRLRDNMRERQDGSEELRFFAG